MSDTFEAANAPLVRCRRVLAIIAVSLTFSSTACVRRSSPEGDEDAGRAAETTEAPPTIRVSADRRELVFSYPRPDGKGFETATRLEQVPETSRQTVVVTDLSLSPEERKAGQYVYIADLRQARADGTYPVAIASRFGFEATRVGTSSISAGTGGEVVIYTTSWCGVCKQAKRLLKSLGVRFVEKDIEGSRSAAEELAAKAQRANIQPGGVPVIDVGGILLQGLDEGTLKSTLKQKGFL